MKCIILLFITALLLIGTGGYVAANQDGSWTINQLVQRGLAENAELRSFEADIEAAKGEKNQAGLWKNPEISGGYGPRTVKSSDGTDASDFNRNISITQTFEFPGKASLRKAIAEKNIELALLGLDQYKLALRGEITKLAQEYLAASDEADAAEEVSDRCRALIKLLAQRPAAGVPQFLELKTIQGSLIELQKAGLEHTQARDEARLELNRLVGFPPNSPLKLVSEEATPVVQARSEQIILQGLSRNYQLKIRLLEIDKAVKTLSAAKLDVAPDFTVGPYFSQDKAGDDEINYGVSISTTLPLWNWNQGNVQTARAQKEQADILLLDARRKVEEEILRRLRSWELTQKELTLASESTVEDLRNAADLADRQYRTGGINVQLFLESERTYLEAQRTRREAILQSWKDALDLDLLIGGTLETLK